MKRLAVIIAVGLLTTGVVGGVFWMKVRDERTQLDQLQVRVAELEKAPPPAPPAPATPVAPAPATTMAPAAPARTAAAPARPPPATKSAEDPIVAETKQMLASGAGRDMMRAALQQQYPDLGKELGLSDAEAHNLLDMLARQQVELSAESMSLLGGATPDPKAMQEIERKAEEKQRANETELTSLLGNKYADFQQYQATAAARLQVSRLQTALGSTNALNEEQGKKLIAVLATAEKRLNDQQRNEPQMKGSNAQEIFANQAKAAERNMRGMFEAASPLLTFAQREIYKHQLDQDIGMLSSIMSTLGGAPQ